MEHVFERVDVDRRALWTRVGAFSGGNQQKIAIAKWLFAESRVLLLFDPTRGIDVGTKNELYRLMRAYADAGGAVLFYSTEIPELVHLADRVLVFYQGAIADEISGDRLTEEGILRAALGAQADREGGLTMSSAVPSKLASPPRLRMRLNRLGRHRGLAIAIAVFLILLAIVFSIGSVRLSYYDLSQMAASGATLALAAVGQTIVILSGGFDLSAGRRDLAGQCRAGDVVAGACDCRRSRWWRRASALAWPRAPSTASSSPFCACSRSSSRSPPCSSCRASRC